MEITRESTAPMDIAIQFGAITDGLIDDEEIEDYVAEAELEEIAKGIVVWAFRNGPIESIHAGKQCPTCSGSAEYSRITDDEMKGLNKFAVDRVFAALEAINLDDTHTLAQIVARARIYADQWDDPEPVPPAGSLIELAD